MSRFLVVALILAACVSTQDAEITTTSVVQTPVETTVVTETTAPTDCPPAPYRVAVLPARVSGSQIPAENLAIDEFTSIPGTHSTIWVAADGSTAVALVRGALPPVEWPGTKGEVTIDGARGVAGPFDDGTWVVAWYEEPGARCDLYTMVFYAPVEPTEVEATIESLDRVAG